MIEQPVVLGIGLPRSAGQALQCALAMLTGRTVWHSPGRELGIVKPGDGGAVEVMYPLSWILRTWPSAWLIYNDRELEPWLKSCSRVYHQSRPWSNPIWKLPLDCFPDYYREYRRARIGGLRRWRYNILVHDFCADPSWRPLCKFLRLPEPSMPFPNVDPVGRP